MRQRTGPELLSSVYQVDDSEFILHCEARHLCWNSLCRAGHDWPLGVVIISNAGKIDHAYIIYHFGDG